MGVFLITGANRGLGQEVCRALVEKGHTAIAASRKPTAVKHGEPLALDVLDPASLGAAVAEVKARHGHLDGLVNNAAIVLDQGTPLLELEPATLRDTLETNLVAPLRVAQAFWPLLHPGVGKRSRVVNVSSMSGQLSLGEIWAPAYGISKTALNALTVQLAAAGQRDGILVNCVCPGWVRTDMGGSNAPRSVAEGVAGILWLLLEAPTSLTGTFTRDGKPLPW